MALTSADYGAIGATVKSLNEEREADESGEWRAESVERLQALADLYLELAPGKHVDGLQSRTPEQEIPSGDFFDQVSFDPRARAQHARRRPGAKGFRIRRAG